MNKEHKEYLDNLRKEGTINMYNATGLLMLDFCVDKQTARKILMEWIDIELDKSFNAGFLR